MATWTTSPYKTFFSKNLSCSQLTSEFWKVLKTFGIFHSLDLWHGKVLSAAVQKIIMKTFWKCSQFFISFVDVVLWCCVWMSNNFLREFKWDWYSPFIDAIFLLLYLLMFHLFTKFRLSKKFRHLMNLISHFISQLFT